MPSAAYSHRYQQPIREDQPTRIGASVLHSHRCCTTLLAAVGPQACPGVLLEPQWSQYYNESSGVVFALLGDKATSGASRKTWSNSRDICRSLGPSWDMAYYDDFQQQWEVEHSYMFVRNMDVRVAQDYCYYMGYYTKSPLAECPAGSVYPDRISCFFKDWSNWAVGFERADGIPGTTSPYPIKQGNGTYIYTWWGSNYNQAGIDSNGAEPASGTRCILALVDYMYSSFNGTSWNATRTITNFINTGNKTFPASVWGWADADDSTCSFPCRVLCRGTCDLQGDEAAAQARMHLMCAPMLIAATLLAASAPVASDQHACVCAAWQGMSGS